jgi:ABC-type Fe3+ transport system permease subunit
MHSIPGRRLIISAFLVFLLLPIYWLVNMSFKTNNEIVTTMTLWPHQPTIANYMRIFTDESWYSGYLNSLKYVLLNTVISISVALPAAYGFSRYRFLGDKHLFFWLLSNRMAPAAVYRAAVLQCLFGDRPVRAPGRWRWRCIFNVARGLDLEGLSQRAARGSMRPRSRQLFVPRFFLRSWCR